MRIFFISIFVFGLYLQSYTQSANTPAKEMKSKSYPFLLYLPDNYKTGSEKKWPLVIYLHGKSACGANLDKVRRYGMPFYLDRGMKLEAIAVAPQCPLGKNWVSDNWFLPFLNDLKEKYSIDESRIYLTGMSLGGFGTFSLAIKYPQIFAAVAPLCGGGQPVTACPMKDIPTWVFHGDKDEQVPIARSTEMVEAIRKCGGNPKYTILKGQPHDIHKTYGNPELYEWMMKQSKDKSVEPVKNFVKESSKNQMVRDSALKPLKSKGFFLKRLFKKKDKKLDEPIVEEEKIKVEFK